jgi:hypothetical protein
MYPKLVMNARMDLPSLFLKNDMAFHLLDLCVGLF